MPGDGGVAATFRGDRLSATQALDRRAARVSFLASPGIDPQGLN
jgi:hypothetical protein